MVPTASVLTHARVETMAAACVAAWAVMVRLHLASVWISQSANVPPTAASAQSVVSDVASYIAWKFQTSFLFLSENCICGPLCSCPADCKGDCCKCGCSGKDCTCGASCKCTAGSCACGVKTA